MQVRQTKGKKISLEIIQQSRVAYLSEYKKYTQKDIRESESINTIRNLLPPKYVKTNLILEGDKTPYYDGFIEILDDSLHPIGQLRVQIKTLSKKEPPRYQVEKADLEDYERNPTLFIAVDNENNLAYWIYLNKNEVNKLKPIEKDSKSVHFPKENIIEKNEIKGYLDSWRRILNSTSEILQRLNIFDVDSAEIIIQKEISLNDFLDKIEIEPDDLSYNQIDKLFIEPIDYPEIRKKIATNKVIIFSGTAGYGKTYLSVRLLWEYYSIGYNPVWIRGDSFFDRVTRGNRFGKILSYLKPHSIIYFEDPFGKNRYEQHEDLESEIDIILDLIKDREDLFYIITSREEILKEFQSRCTRSVDLDQYIHTISIIKPFYNLLNRKQMLMEWAKSMQCIWIKNEILNKKVISIMNESILPTPLSIWSFIIATRMICDGTKLLQIATMKSVKISEVFAKEIELMSVDKQIFLCIIFLDCIRDIKEISVLYGILIKNPEIMNAYIPESFQTNFNWFKNDKIRIQKYPSGQILKFSHPLYYETLDQILIKNTPCRKVLFQIIAFLSQIENLNSIEKKRNFALFIIKYFESLPVWIRDLIPKLFDSDEEVPEHIALYIIEQYNSLTPNIQKMIPILAERNQQIRSLIAYHIILNYRELPFEFKKHLPEYINGTEYIEEITRAVLVHYTSLPYIIQKMVPELILASEDGIEDFVSIFDDLPSNVRSKLQFLTETNDEIAHALEEERSLRYRIPGYRISSISAHIIGLKYSFKKLDLWFPLHK